MKKLLELTFPEDYQKEDLKGAQVEFKITAKAVKAAELAPLDDAAVLKVTA